MKDHCLEPSRIILPSLASFCTEATLVDHHGTSKIMSSQKSVNERESHLIKKDCCEIEALDELIAFKFRSSC